MEIDGDLNSVVECNTYTEEDECQSPRQRFLHAGNAAGNRTGGVPQGQPGDAAVLKVINPNKLNRVGRPVGYKLEPAHLLTQFVKPDVAIRRTRPVSCGTTCG